MPGLIACRRRWAIGSDDLVVPALVVACGNVLCTSFLGVSLWEVPSRPSNASNGSLLEAMINIDAHWLAWEDYWIGLQSCAVLGFLVLCIFVECTIAWISTRGSVLDTAKRKIIVYPLYLRLFLAIVQLVIGCFALTWFIYHSHCLWEHSTYLGATIWNLASSLSIVLLIWGSWDHVGRRWIRLLKFEHNFAKREQRPKISGLRRNWRRRKMEIAHRDRWTHRCQLMCCCVGGSRGDKQESYHEIGRIFSRFFEDLDVVPSDVITGLILLRRRQKQDRSGLVKRLNPKQRDTVEMLSCGAPTGSTIFLTMGREDDRAQVERGLYYMHYALASYGWPFYLNYHTCCETFSMLRGVRCCSRMRHAVSEVIGDDCCGLNYTALRETLVAPSEVEVVYASFSVDVYRLPFFVAVDHAQRQVVVTVRGTLSVNDVLTDLVASVADIAVPGRNQRFGGHMGAVKSAIKIYDELKEKSILERAFSRCDSTYGLLLVGHSLGGGVATILSIYLRDAYPRLKCICFAPPGGLMTKETAEYTKEFVNTFIVGKDCVARVGLPQLERLRTQLQEVLAESEETKWRTIMKTLICRNRTSSRHANRSIASHSAEPAASAPLVDAEAPTMPLEHTPVSRSPSSEHSGPPSRSEPMYPPGRIIHIVRTWMPGKRKKQMPNWTAYWAENDSFPEVLISPMMVRDHMPDGLFMGLRSLLACDRPEPRLYANLLSQRTATDDALTERLCILSPFGPPLATPERSDVPAHTASLLAQREAAASSAATLTVYDNVNQQNHVNDRNEPSDFAQVSDGATPSCTLNDIPSPYNFLDAGSAGNSLEDLDTDSPYEPIGNNNHRSQADSVVMYSRTCSTIPEVSERSNYV